MIRAILTLLEFDDWFIGDDHIDMAKGKYELVDNLKDYRKQLKRWRKTE